MRKRNRKKKKEEIPTPWKKFLKDFNKRFDAKKETNCDYHNCKARLNPKQIQVFTHPNLEPKIYCFEHLLATLFRYDKEKFEEIINANYLPPIREAQKMYFEQKYANQN